MNLLWYHGRMRIIQTAVGPKRVPLTGYLQDMTMDGGIRNIRPTIIVCPGGGYTFRSERERDPVALHFLAMSYNVFILDYSVGEDAGDLNPLLELSDALMRIREHAVRWMCDPTRVAVIGFSAGAHLAASIAVLHDHKKVANVQKVVDANNRPDAVILAYPVITGKEYAHKGSFEQLSRGNAEIRALLSLEDQVRETATPAFIWHTVTDQGVLVENSLLLAQAYRKAKVPFELHLFEEGDHGLSMCTEEVGTPHAGVRPWVELATNWLNHRFMHNL